MSDDERDQAPQDLPLIPDGPQESRNPSPASGTAGDAESQQDAPERPGPPRWVGISIGFTLGAILFGAFVLVTDPWGPGSMTCEKLGRDAVRISAAQDGDPLLLDVESTLLVADSRETYTEPTGADLVVLMKCTGDATWSDDSDAAVSLTLEVDAEGKTRVVYQPVASAPLPEGTRST